MRIRSFLIALLALGLMSMVPAQAAESIGEGFIVRFDPRVSSASADSMLAARGLVVDERFEFIPGLMRVEASNGAAVNMATAQALESLTSVRYVEPDSMRHIDATPNDPSFTALWGLNNTGQSGGVPDADIDAPEVWDLSTGSTDVAVMVIDTGVDIDHPDLVANLFFNAAECNGTAEVDDDANGYVDDCRGFDTANDDGNPDDDHGHGTHVAGTIGAVGDNGIGVVGVNWDVTIVACKFLAANGSGSTSDAIGCLNYLLQLRSQGVPIIASNNSWGGGSFSQGLLDAINAVGAQGVGFVAAAGNDGTDNDAAPHYPSSYGGNNVLAVASTTRTDAMSSFSNRGITSVDLGAPGSSIYSTVPGGTYSSSSGTSMATPQVAGCLALLKSLFPAETGQQLQARMMANVDSISALNGKVSTGGRLNCMKAAESGADPKIQLTARSVSVAENGGSVTIPVTRSGSTESSVGVSFATTEGSAVPGSDYTSSAGTLSFPSGVWTVDIVIPIVDDADWEPSETFTVSLSDPTGGATLGSLVSATITILDDDASPVVQPDASVAKWSSGPFRGGGIINANGLNQTVGKNARKGMSKSFYMRIRNTEVGTGQDAIEVLPLDNPQGLSVRYFFRGSNVTSEVRSGNFDVLISRGSRVGLRVDLTFTRSFAAGTKRWMRIAVVSVNSGDLDDFLFDVVKVQLTYR